MRLSEIRIRQLAKQMARQMIGRGAARGPSGAQGVADIIAKTMIRDQQIEEEIEAEARESVSRQRNLPPPGSGEYQAAFLQTKRALAARRGFTL